MAVRTEKDGAVWTIIHDRPETRNAMDPKSADALTAAFIEFGANKNASVAVLYGAGGTFCAGWDLNSSALSILSTRSVSSTSRPPGDAALVVRFHVDLWDLLASNWTNP
jgi:enoyl-CoA hydratase/carnithine racemase